MALQVIFSILNNLSLRRNIYLNIQKFTRENKPLFWQKWTPVVFSYFRLPCWCPSEGHQHGVSMLSSIKLCGTFCQITRVRNTTETWHLDRFPIYLSSITCQFLDFIHGMVSIFLFNGVTVKINNFVPSMETPWKCFWLSIDTGVRSVRKETVMLCWWGSGNDCLVLSMIAVKKG